MDYERARAPIVDAALGRFTTSMASRSVYRALVASGWSKIVVGAADVSTWHS